MLDLLERDSLYGSNCGELTFAFNSKMNKVLNSRELSRSCRVEEVSSICESCREETLLCLVQEVSNVIANT